MVKRCRREIDSRRAVSSGSGTGWTTSRWPADKCRKGVSFSVHKVQTSIEIEAERFAAIETPDPAGVTPGRVGMPGPATAPLDPARIAQDLVRISPWHITLTRRPPFPDSALP
ncbi:DUF6192 family protein [Streptomyces sp. NPDC056470]|uniref:DUF6192 family protein n=1 Tax=Streptomyces sp. NPDC056470 TaxID=3345831 RepID=UPI0036A836D2